MEYSRQSEPAPEERLFVSFLWAICGLFVDFLMFVTRKYFTFYRRKSYCWKIKAHCTTMKPGVF